MKGKLGRGFTSILIAANLPLAAMADSNIGKLTAEDCKNYPSLLPKDGTKEDRDGAISASSALAMSSLLRYLASKDSVFADYYQELKNKKEKDPNTLFNSHIQAAKGEIQSEDQQRYIREFAESVEKANVDTVRKHWNTKSPYKEFVEVSSRCLIKATAEQEDSQQNEIIQGLVKLSRSKVTSDRIEYFLVSIESCKISDSAETGSRYSEPKQWPGSRFLIIDALFKNEDAEGRLPAEGSLIIRHNGRELRYDTTESIIKEGYGIYFKSVNPLVKMPTKIVYRIPDNVSGEVSWEPGRNPEGKRLWCTFATPKDSKSASHVK